MSESEKVVPVISVAPIAANVDEESIDDQAWISVGNELVKAFTDTGFCYVKDHGIDPKILKSCIQLSKDFFHLPIETKKQRLRGKFDEDFFGWLPKPNTPGIDVQPETFDANLPPDYKETYNLSDNLDESRFPSDDEVPWFRDTTLKLIKAMELLSSRLLVALGYSLNLEDPRALWRLSSKTGTKQNSSTLRYAFYPRVPPHQTQEKMLRCAEHTDFGHITLLVDNGVSGLQIKQRDGDFLMVPRQEGALAVNICDSLERVTGGILRSAPHRVVITEDNAKEDRYSLIYFRVPDGDAYLDPLCGEKEKYKEKITANEFFVKRFSDIFIKGAGIGQNAT